MSASLGPLCLRTVATIYELIGFIYFFFLVYFILFYFILLPLTLNTVFNYRESIDSN